MATVFTTKGDMEDSWFEKREGTIDNDNEHTTCFGGDQVALNQTFQINFPSPLASTAIVRVL